MLRSASRMLGYRLSAADGELGQCLDLLLEDRFWVVRHVVVKAAARFGGQRLSISPLALPKAEWQFRHWVFEGSSEWLRTASGSDVAEHKGHFILPPPLAEATADSFEDSAIELVPEPLDDLDDLDDLEEDEAGAIAESGIVESPLADSRMGKLISLVELLGHGVEAAEGGHLGQVADVISNDDSWSCPYLVVTDLTSVAGRKVLVPTDWVRFIDPAGRRVQLFASIAQMRSEPDFLPESMLRVLGAAALERSLLPAPPLQASPASAWTQAFSRGARGMKAAFARKLHGRVR